MKIVETLPSLSTLYGHMHMYSVQVGLGTTHVYVAGTCYVVQLEEGEFDLIGSDWGLYARLHVSQHLAALRVLES